jgi:putative hydrolase of the HAD superfamily
VLATNQEHWRAAFLAERVGEVFPLHAVLYSADLGTTKDDAAFFDLASDRLGVSLRRDVVFADDAEENVASARSAGWSAHFVTRTNGWADAVASDLGLD